MLKELEMVESNMVNTIFFYNKITKDQHKETIKQVVNEHRSGYMDPVSKNKDKKAAKDKLDQEKIWKVRTVKLKNEDYNTIERMKQKKKQEEQ